MHLCTKHSSRKVTAPSFRCQGTLEVKSVITKVSRILSVWRHAARVAKSTVYFFFLKRGMSERVLA